MHFMKFVMFSGSWGPRAPYKDFLIFMFGFKSDRYMASHGSLIYQFYLCFCMFIFILCVFRCVLYVFIFVLMRIYMYLFVVVCFYGIHMHFVV